jgi:hypothetical protein
VQWALLDTEVFIHENLRFDSRRFQELVGLVASGQVKILLTDVIVGEVERAIVNRVKDALSLLKQPATKRLFGSLAQSSNPLVSGLAARHNEGEIIAELRSGFGKLVGDLEAEIILTDTVKVAELRRRFFGSVFPFGLKDDKRHEFPDALTFLAVQSWAESSDRRVHMVSRDQGLLDAARSSDSFQPIESLSGLIDLLIKARDDRSKAAQDALDHLRDEIEEAVARAFMNASFFVEDNYGEVSDVELQSLDITRFDLVDLNNERAEYDLEATVEFTAEVSYDDPDQSYYDREEGRMIVLGQIEKPVSDRGELSARLIIALDVVEPSRSTIEALDLIDGDVFVSV